MKLTATDNSTIIEIYQKDTLKVICKDQSDRCIGELFFGTIILQDQEFITLDIPDLFMSTGGLVICRNFNVDEFIKDGITFTRVNQFPQDISE